MIAAGRKPWPQNAADERKMLWVDCDTYFGPDRRAKAGGLRLVERRKHDCAGVPPPLNVAMRNLRLRALDAHGASAGEFAQRAASTALLAEMHEESEAAFELSSLSESVLRHRGQDMRPIIYKKLDQAHAVLRAA